MYHYMIKTYQLCTSVHIIQTHLDGLPDLM